VIGEWWTLLIIRDALFGVTRFDEFQKNLGIARNILANRLDTLVAAGVMERQCYDEGRSRYDYVLTDKGRALWPVIVTLRQWGDSWILGEGNEISLLRHKHCGEITTGVLVCDHCGEAIDQSNVRSVRGPRRAMRGPRRSPTGDGGDDGWAQHPLQPKLLLLSVAPLTMTVRAIEQPAVRDRFWAERRHRSTRREQPGTVIFWSVMQAVSSQCDRGSDTSSGRP
jgi:DNA-binding HxlR family transcriptional regulator